MKAIKTQISLRTDNAAGVEKFGPGDEEKLFARTDVDFDRLARKGKLEGDWSRAEDKPEAPKADPKK